MRSALQYYLAGGGADADAMAYRNAVLSNGGAVPGAWLAVVSAFIRAEKAAGLWALTDDYLGLWAPNEIAARTSLKQRRLATVTGTPTFTADRGYVFNGSTNYIDTGFVPSTHAVAMTLNSTHAEVYERTNVDAANKVTFGGTSASNRSIAAQARNGINAVLDGNSAFGTYALPTANSQGLTQWGRSGALTTDAYGAKNGAAMVRTVTPSAVGASLPAVSMYIGAYNNAGTPSAHRPCSVGYVAWGAALTSGQWLTRYTNVQAFATAVGAQV